ncbi:2OG-Fe(II) oxygenase family oxidoreductase [Coniochaeta sp. 2T2.1]|nr:2OG-Fe(II) oxygenase family oxidoreductase [Coniochaeta sp. 2T2.1]
MLMPISVLILSLLRCGQYISANGGINFSGLSFSSLCNGLGSLVPSSSTAVGHRKLDADTYTCDQSYTVELLSLDPLVMYINNFMREEEIDHILNIAKDTYQPSVVFAGSDGFREVLNRTMRSSENTVLPKEDIVSQCLTRRMQSLLGNVQHVEVEALQVVKYAQGGDHYNAHTDWFDAPKFDLSYGSDRESRNASDPSNRLGSIFAYLEDNCERGETYFPHLPSVLKTADGSKFALAAGDTGLLVKPRRGNAIFWNNLHANGTGDERTAHLGLPVTSGTKTGLNIWSRYFLDTVMVGGD